MITDQTADSASPLLPSRPLGTDGARVSAIGFGKFFEYLEHQQGWSVTNIRRAAQFSAYFCSGVGLLLCGYMQNAMAAYACMIMVLVSFYCVYILMF